jgi:hypothetical protein
VLKPAGSGPQPPPRPPNNALMPYPSRRRGADRWRTCRYSQARQITKGTSMRDIRGDLQTEPTWFNIRSTLNTQFETLISQPNRAGRKPSL